MEDIDKSKNLEMYTKCNICGKELDEKYYRIDLVISNSQSNHTYLPDDSKVVGYINVSICRECLPEEKDNRILIHRFLLQPIINNIEYHIMRNKEWINRRQEIMKEGYLIGMKYKDHKKREEQ